MGLSFWIYIIITIVIFIVRQMKKSAQNNIPTEQPRRDPDPDTTTTPMTFEELLREIQASKTPQAPKEIQSAKPIRPAKPIQKSYEVDYDEDIEEEEKDLETIPAKDYRSYEDKPVENRSYEIYEKAKKEAFERKSLEETMKLSDTVMKYDHFKEYDDTSRKSLAGDILNDFKDPDGFRKAFIMSEILKRKF
jgi:hypothetical protein